jgi:hypothetical protein
MLFKKFTTGVVEQVFNDSGECISQKFLIPDSNSVEYETEDGDPINVMNMPFCGSEYFKFDMVQPERLNTVNLKSGYIRLRGKIIIQLDDSHNIIKEIHPEDAGYYGLISLFQIT